MNMATADLYGTMDPFQRTSISPKRRGPGNDSDINDFVSVEYQVNICLMLSFSLDNLLMRERTDFSVNLKFDSLSLSLHSIIYQFRLPHIQMKEDHRHHRLFFHLRILVECHLRFV